MSLGRSPSTSRKTLERRLGFAIRRYPVVGTLAAELRTIVAHVEIDGVIDVGGHHGQFGKILRRDVRYRGPINSFEPFPESFDALRAASSEDAEWSIHNIAIGTDSGTEELNVYTKTDFNSLHHLGNKSGTQFDGVEPVSAIPVEVARLDSLYESGWGNRLLLKSDTQGNDLPVVSSADGIMDKIYAIQVEAGTVPIYDDTPSLTETISSVTSLGFGASSFHPVTYHKNSRTVVEFDIIFVRR